MRVLGALVLAGALALVGPRFFASDPEGELTRENPACVQDAADPLEPRREFAVGKFRGRCVGTDGVRPLVVDREDEQYFYVHNFYHDKIHWRARIPIGRVTAVYFQIVPFASGVPLIKAAHTQFRFLLSEPIALEAQNSARKASVPDVIVSSTFTAPRGVEYEALKSIGTGYGLATRAISSHARGIEEIVKDKSVVRQFNLKLSAHEMNALLAAALRIASRDSYSLRYGLLDSNCTTWAFDVLDEVRARPDGVPAMRGSIWRIRDEFEGPSIEALRARKLIDENSEVRPMNDERDWSKE